MSGPGVKVMVEDGLGLGEDEADKAKGGVEAAATSCGGMLCTILKKRRRQNVDNRKISLISTAS